jgi:glycosyltransferase involved in cell wall biosynthesis
MSKKSLVSVVMVTYQHENYIKDAINAVLMQKCDHQIELIIGDDCSTDNTGKVINDIIKNHQRGHLVKYHRHEKNIGLASNYSWCLNKSKGEFIALCDGDDYWTDEYKLQKQLDIIKAEKSVVLTYHLCRNIDSNGDIISEKKTPFTSTILFRNLISKMPHMNGCPNPDQFVYTFLSLHGDFKYLENVGHTVRRFHSGGVMSMQNLNTKLQRQVNTWTIIYDVFKNTKLKKHLFAKRNTFIYRNYLFNWDKNKYNLNKILLFPVSVNQLKLYKLLIRKLINREQQIGDNSISAS